MLSEKISKQSENSSTSFYDVSFLIPAISDISVISLSIENSPSMYSISFAALNSPAASPSGDSASADFHYTGAQQPHSSSSSAYYPTYLSVTTPHSLRATALRDRRGRPDIFALDKELMSIFERTYGQVKNRADPYNLHTKALSFESKQKKSRRHTPGKSTF